MEWNNKLLVQYLSVIPEDWRCFAMQPRLRDTGYPVSTAGWSWQFGIVHTLGSILPMR